MHRCLHGFVAQPNVKGDGCGVLSPSVGLISKLMEVEGWWELVGPVFA